MHIWTAKISANQPVGNYWFKAITIGECNVGNNNANGIAILRYDGAPTSNPSQIKDKFVPTLTNPVTVNKVYPTKTETWKDGMVGAIIAAELTSFNNMPNELKGTPDYTLYISMDQIINDPLYNDPLLDSNDMQATLNLYAYDTANFNNISFTFPSFPLLLRPSEMKQNTFCNENTIDQQACYEERCCCTHKISIPFGSTVEIFLINESKKRKGSAGHPIHIHGYHVYLVGLNKVGGTSVESSEIQRMNEAGEIPKNLKNPTLRDTIQVTGGGYAVCRFKADNPGLWFFHCHVQTHMLEGQSFILQVGDAADFDVPRLNRVTISSNNLQFVIVNANLIPA